MAGSKDLKVNYASINQTPQISIISSLDKEGTAFENSEETLYLASLVSDAASGHVVPNLNVSEVTTRLAKTCQRNMFRTNKYWMKTELLLLELEQEQGVYFASEEVAAENAIAEQDDNYETVSETESNTQSEVSISRASSFQSSILLTQNESENTSEAVDLETFLQEIHLGSELTLADDEYESFIERAIDGFKQIFQDLIENEIEPYDLKMRVFLREVLTIRRYESELLSLATAIRTEVSVISENLAKTIGIKDLYWKRRLKRCEPALTELYLKLDRAQTALTLLLSRFDRRLMRNTESLANICDKRARVLAAYRSFRDSHISKLNCSTKELLECTNAREFKRRTIWHLRLDSAEFKSLLAGNLQALLVTSNTVQIMVQLIHGSFMTVNRAFRVFNSSTIDRMFRGLKIKIHALDGLSVDQTIANSLGNFFRGSTAGSTVKIRKKEQKDDEGEEREKSKRNDEHNSTF